MSTYISIFSDEAFKRSTYEYSNSLLYSWRIFLTISSLITIYLVLTRFENEIDKSQELITCVTIFDVPTLAYGAVVDIIACSVNLLLFIIPLTKLIRSSRKLNDASIDAFSRSRSVPMMRNYSITNKNIINDNYNDDDKSKNLNKSINNHNNNYGSSPRSYTTTTTTNININFNTNIDTNYSDINSDINSDIDGGDTIINNNVKRNINSTSNTNKNINSNTGKIIPINYNNHTRNENVNSNHFSFNINDNHNHNDTGNIQQTQMMWNTTSYSDKNLQMNKQFMMNQDQFKGNSNNVNNNNNNNLNVNNYNDQIVEIGVQQRLGFIHGSPVLSSSPSASANANPYPSENGNTSVNTGVNPIGGISVSASAGGNDIVSGGVNINSVKSGVIGISSVNNVYGSNGSGHVSAAEDHGYDSDGGDGDSDHRRRAETVTSATVDSIEIRGDLGDGRTDRVRGDRVGNRDVTGNGNGSGNGNGGGDCARKRKGTETKLRSRKSSAASGVRMQDEDVLYRIGKKLTVLTMIGTSSTVGALVLVALFTVPGLWFGIDSTLNVISALLMYYWNQKYYKMLCKCCL